MAESKKPKSKPKFNKRIFWDVAFDKIDYDAKANFVIERVFERGDVSVIRNCRRYYLASAVIDRPIEEFRCYTLRQLNPTLFPY